MQKRRLIYTAIKRPFLKIFLTFTCSIKYALYLLEYWPKTYIKVCSTLAPGPFPFPRHGKHLWSIGKQVITFQTDRFHVALRLFNNWSLMTIKSRVWHARTSVAHLPMNSWEPRFCSYSVFSSSVIYCIEQTLGNMEFRHDLKISRWAQNRQNNFN